MKKLPAILFILILVLPFLGTYGWLQHQRTIVKKQVKKQIIAGLDHDELVLLKFSKIESTLKLRWKHSKEFEYDNQMYDIVSEETLNDTVYYWCWLDNEETLLEIQLKKLVNFALGHNNQTKKRQDTLNNFVQSLFIEPCIELDFRFKPTVNKPFAYYTKTYHSIQLSPISPPPKSSL